MNVMRVLLFVAAGVIVMSGINSSGVEKLSDIIPAYIGEKKANINIYNLQNYIYPQQVNIEIKNNPVKCLEICYNFNTERKINVEFKLPEKHIEGERISFKLLGNGLKDKIELWCKDGSSYIPLSMVSLKPKKWQHIEIPASSPIHRFYQNIKVIRFTIVNKEKKPHSGKFLISQMNFVNPVLLSQPIKKKNVPSPVFETWGAGGRSWEELEKNIKRVKEIGINLHIIPVDFPALNPEKTKENREILKKRILYIINSGMKVGVSFYNTPTKEFVSKYPELLMKNEEGKIYKEGGFFLSIWNPKTEEIWEKHIVDTLRFLKKEGILSRIDVIKVSPGLESEISYEWSHIWAFDKYAILKYREYLKKKYQNITSLNYDWGSEYKDFEDITPPKKFYPDREHWVFLDFYRYSMFKWCVKLADFIREVYNPPFWLWLPHSVPNYPARFYSARFPLFYVENLKKLGIADYVHIPALDWQSVQDVNFIKNLGVKTIGEVDVIPTKKRLIWTFEQSLKYKFDGIFIGTIENICSEGNLTPIGETCKKLIEKFRKGGEEK